MTLSLEIDSNENKFWFRGKPRSLALIEFTDGTKWWYDKNHVLYRIDCLIVVNSL